MPGRAKKNPANHSFPFSVLIVDDENEIREQLRICFESEGCMVFDAGSGNEAYDVWMKQKPDVVITDIRMADGTGEELLTRLNQEMVGERSVIICMSGFSDLETHTAYEYGADALFHKPFDLKALVSAARHFAQLRQKHHEAVNTVSRFKEDLRRIAGSMLKADSEELRSEVDLHDLKQLASMIMHEINGPLAVINMNAALLPDTLESAIPRISSAVKMAKNIERNSQKLNDIIHALRDLFVSRDATRVPISVNQIISDAVRHLQEEGKLGSNVIHVEGREQPAWVKGDRQQLIQVAKNLIDNASYANNANSNTDIFVHITMTDDKVHFSIADQGVGISEAISGRIFEPYFSTKADQGTGMGLHICKQIVENHGGSIVVDGSCKVGAKFDVNLPRFKS